MGKILRAGRQQVINLSTGETVYKRDGDISIEQQALAGIGVRDVGELMLGNAELLCQNCTVTLRLRQQHHEIRVIQNVLDFPAGQQVFHILRQRRGDAALFAEHFPDRHKVAGCQRVTEQDVELVKVAPSRHALGMVGVYRRRDKFIGGVHGDFAEVFTQAL